MKCRRLLFLALKAPPSSPPTRSITVEDSDSDDHDMLTGGSNRTSDLLLPSTLLVCVELFLIQHPQQQHTLHGGHRAMCPHTGKTARGRSRNSPVPAPRCCSRQWTGLLQSSVAATFGWIFLRSSLDVGALSLAAGRLPAGLV